MISLLIHAMVQGVLKACLLTVFIVFIGLLCFPKQTSAQISVDRRQIGQEFSSDGRILREENIFRLNRISRRLPSADSRFTNEENNKVEGRQRREIFGNDERLPVEDRDIERFPYCVGGYLSTGCSGVLIGPYHALTAAHCVFDEDSLSIRMNENVDECGIPPNPTNPPPDALDCNTDNETDFNSTTTEPLTTTTETTTTTQAAPGGITFWQGRTCNTQGQPMTVERIWLLRGFTQPFLRNNNKQLWDYALLILDRDSPAENWASFGYRKECDDDAGFDVFGYPRDRFDEIEGGDDVEGCFCRPMWFSSCHHSETVQNGLMYRYRCDTFQGNDGSPLYSETRTDPLRGRSVYGVVTDRTDNWNLGVRFDKFRFCQLVLWIADSGYNPVCGNRPNCGCRA